MVKHDAKLFFFFVKHKSHGTYFQGVNLIYVSMDKKF